MSVDDSPPVPDELTAAPPPPDDGRGDRLILASWVGTAAYAAVAIASTVAPDTFQGPLVIVCLVLFAIGFGSGFLAYAIAIGRSRHDAIGMGGLFFLLGTAPTRVRWHLLGAFVAQIVLAVVFASVGLAVLPQDATNVLAFGVLTPLYGLGVAGLWGARFGTFSPRAGPPA